VQTGDGVSAIIGFRLLVSTRRRSRSASVRSRVTAAVGRRTLACASVLSSDGGFGAGGEAELWDLVELADVPGQLEEREQAGPLARAEAVPELFEVAR
jgi:hypothetical protein